ncbi:flavin-containing monooxygenase [Blastococcus sp. SYSU D00820]
MTMTRHGTGTAGRTAPAARPRAARGRRVRVAVVGAGLGGIAAAVKLHQAGFSDVTVFEQSAGPGGTWWDNTYPGAAVDVPSNVYSFSFMPYDWSRSYGRQPELQQYCEDTIDHFGLRDRFRFSTRVERAVWDEDRSVYVVTAGGEEQEFELLVSCVGLLNVPNEPRWPGMDEFEGVLFHSARWRHDVDLAGKRVAVIGTGSSSAQIVPALAGVAGHLYVFQREPGWIVPKPEEDYTEEQRRRNMQLVRRKVTRWHGFVKHVQTLGDRQVGSRRHQRLTRMCLDHIEAQIPDLELRRLVTPTYPVGCKRLVRDSNFYPALTRPDVTLVPRAVTRLTRTGIVDADGVEREVDVVVAAIGFRAADYLASLEVVGPDGVSLREAWAGDPKAFLGITVPGFPNFFMLYGPNTNGGGSIIAQHERQAELVVTVARRLQRGVTRVDTRPEAMERFVRWVDRGNDARFSAILGNCHNYFLAPSGRNVTQWPTGQISYLTRSKLMPWVALAMQRESGGRRGSA